MTVTQFPQTKTVLVLGASGKVGQLVQNAGPAALAGLRILPISRAQADPGQDLPRADAIWALWGVTQGNQMDLAQNTELALRAIRIADQTGADRVLHASSIAVYGTAKPQWSETDPVRPVSPYGAAKGAMEQAIAKQPTKVRSVILRIGSVAGAESLFAAGTAQGQITLDQFPDGHGPTRSYIAPVDLARCLTGLTQIEVRDLPDIVNVGGPAPIRMQDLAGAMGWPVTWRPAPDGALQHATLNTSHLWSLFPEARPARTADEIAQSLKVGQT